MIAAALLLAVQHGGMAMPVGCTPEHAAMGHCQMPAARPRPASKPVPRPVAKPTARPKSPAPAKSRPPVAPPASPTKKIAPAAAASGCTPEHAAMGHCTMPAAAAAPEPFTAAPRPSECNPEHSAMGHCTMPPASAGQASGTDQPAGTAPPPPAPRVDAADAVWGADAMPASRAGLYREHGGGTFSQVMLNIAELRLRDGRDGYHWDGEGWFGGDRDRLVLKSEGGGELGGALDYAEVQALYSRAIGPYFNLQAGVRHDVRPRPNRTHLAVGVEGLAPYWFELEATAFLSTQGRLSGRVEGYYDQRITQRLVLQPRAEVNFTAQDDRAIGVGSGVSDFELGVRLRYELAREFAPYVGVAWERRLGDTARFARAAGGGASDVDLVAGVRFWF